MVHASEYPRGDPRYDLTPILRSNGLWPNNEEQMQQFVLATDKDLGTAIETTLKNLMSRRDINNLQSPLSENDLKVLEVLRDNGAFPEARYTTIIEQHNQLVEAQQPSQRIWPTGSGQGSQRGNSEHGTVDSGRTVVDIPEGTRHAPATGSGWPFLSAVRSCLPLALGSAVLGAAAYAAYPIIKRAKKEFRQEVHDSNLLVANMIQPLGLAILSGAVLVLGIEMWRLRKQVAALRNRANGNG